MKKLSIFIIILLNSGLFFPLYGQDKYERERKKMIKNQIQSRGITDKKTLEAIESVPRHLFVPDEYRDRAYDDGPLPIGYGQTISQPYIVAYMTELLNVGPDDIVLEIGTGSGYQAAVLSRIVKKVYTVEIIEELGLAAKERLKALNYDNVEVKIGDGYYGWEEHAPYDGIIVTAAAEFIPPPLIEQLKDNCNMIIPVGSPFNIQNLMLVKKSGGKITTKSLIPVRFVPLTRKK
ncbi:MAG TPA: protein-L-isoaspartate(D-aspartate) O-methyltransferase [Paludibacteraceae bacterium]|nr:protein-L-isoaspartate(D-aspartate) O-methyltransferase [Paludibacteraceae bacterium]HOL00230.1 protein-L-isoaspartate(D-aspartate) O-methyltransferase [Paludibacteraceae bacterium]HPO67303.1 protein-L-isoaspartate(D-aspartate) O-methyltransferase [Paludibacteraceae bacterium]